MVSLRELIGTLVDAQQRIDYLEDELFRLQGIEEKYKELLHSSVQHSSQMAHGLLGLGLKLAIEGKLPGQGATHD